MWFTNPGNGEREWCRRWVRNLACGSDALPRLSAAPPLASPQLESGNWYVPHPLLAPWVEGFIGECAGIPGRTERVRDRYNYCFGPIFWQR